MMADPTNKEAVEGLASALSSCNDVSVRIDGAIAQIAGTEPQVSQISRAIEAMVSESSAKHGLAHAHPILPRDGLDYRVVFARHELEDWE